jgi:hypothetical protein
MDKPKLRLNNPANPRSAKLARVKRFAVKLSNQLRAFAYK